MKTYSFIKQIIAIIATGIITTGVNAQHFTDFEFVETAPPNIRQAMQNNTKAVFRQIHDAYYSKKNDVTLSRNNATPEAIGRIQALWSTSKFYSVETEIIAKVLQASKGWQVRNIPVMFVEGETDEDKYQDIVLEFAPDGKISDVYIALPMHQYYEVFREANEVTDLRRRQLILGFVENFRTSYNRKDIDYLNRVFSNDALIITGKVLKPAGKSLDPEGRAKIEYVVQNKSQYLTRLNAVFKNNAYINIKFDEIEVIRHDGNTNIYGVTLRQKWNTTNYSDEGWIFLMIDFKDEDNPLIWVRTWEPLEVPRNEVMGLDNFKINR